MDEKLTPEQELEQARAKTQKPGQGLDSAAWLRLGNIAQATHSSLQSQSQAQPAKTPVAASVPRQSQGILAAIAAETWRTLQNGWDKFRHPIQHFRRWLADMMQPQPPQAARGDAPQAGVAPDQPTPPEKGPGRGPTLDQTWNAVRDQLFEAAKDPKADPQKVADSIVAAIPADHKQAMAERLHWLADMAQTTAQSLQAVETKTAAKSAEPERAPLGEPPPEQTFEPPPPDNVRLFKHPPAQRQVPAQPLAEQPKVARPKKTEPAAEKKKAAQR